MRTFYIISYDANGLFHCERRNRGSLHLLVSDLKREIRTSKMTPKSFRLDLPTTGYRIADHRGVYQRSVVPTFFGDALDWCKMHGNETADMRLECGLLS